MRVRPDGSGTIEFQIQRLHSSKAALDEWVADLKLPGERSSNVPPPEEKSSGVDSDHLLSETYQKRKAAEYGNEVRLVSVEEYSTDRGTGYRAVYGFDDITKVKLDYEGGTPPDRRNPITFSYERQSPGELIIHVPLRDLLEKFTAPSSLTDKRYQDRIERGFKGLKSRTVLIPQGKIIESDATHRDDGTIVLRQVEWDKIAGNRPLLDFLWDGKPKTLEQAYAFYARAPGFRYELKPKVTVKWQ